MKFSLKDLNDVQTQAVTSESSRILILAGAGSGKTRTLTSRIAYLISEKGVKPGEILALTFTNKAAKEMKERVAKQIQSQINSLWIGTFHSIFARMLRLEMPALNLDRNFTIYDTDDQIGAMKKTMSSLNIPQQLHSPKLFQSRISRAKNKLLLPENLEQNSSDSFESLLPQVYGEYDKFLRANNAVDFDDLLLLPLDLFDQKPDVMKKYQLKFKHILIDEYQDTNHAQYMVIKRLVGSKNNICVVGDEDQSIYRWRGADIQNILNFSSDFKNTEVYKLEENYRSSQFILSGASSVVTNNQERIGKTLFTNRKKGDKIVLLDSYDELDEAKKVVEQIHNEMFSKKRTFRDIAILYRTNAQSRAIEDELRKNAISYAIIGGVKFYERKEIKDVLAYLKVITNPLDSVSLRRIVNFPLRGIGETTVGKIEKYAESLGVSLFDGMGRVKEITSISSGMAGRVVEFHELITKYRSLYKEISSAELTSALAQETGIIEHIKTEYDQLESETRLNNVYELFNTIEQFSREREAEKKDASLESFLEEVSLLSDVDNLNSEKNSVTLMTLHSSKGLEFPVVFITGLEMGLFPLQRNSAEESELEEERRLLYVGMTRAQENLFLAFARNRRKFNYNLMPSVPSLFIDEIPPEFIEVRQSSRQSNVNQSGTRKQARRKKMLEYFNQPDDSQNNGPEFSVGSLVYHETFGKGKVIGLEGQGDKMKISVKFEGNVTKKLIAQYANLTPLEIED